MTDHVSHAGPVFHSAPPPDPELVADGFMIAIFLLFGVIFAVAPLVAGYLLAPRTAAFRLRSSTARRVQAYLYSAFSR